MIQTNAEWYARLFGLTPERMKTFDDLNDAQKERVKFYYNSIDPEKYIYATKGDDDIVWHRENHNQYWRKQ